MTRVRWRFPLLLSACVVLGQLLRLPPLVDVAAGSTPADVRLVYPLAHVVFAPFTLLADWLNGSPARDLRAAAAWAVAAFLLVRIVRRRRAPQGARAGALREGLAALAFLAALAAFLAWGALLPRPIPRLVAAGADALVFDVHSHTAASHDGRRGFDAAANAAWHGRAGFDAAFVTDHNTTAAIRAWLAAAPRDAPPRLLPGVELSLSGLHLLALGSARDVPTVPYRSAWDATGRLVRALAAGRAPGDGATETGPDAGIGRNPRPFLVASLPEYWQHHWGPDVDTLVAWGVAGFEVWTSSPRAMDFPPALRRAVVARCRRDGLAMFGAADMHGLGYSASVWNVARVPGWKAMDAATLSAALLERFRREGAAASQVVAMRRWLPETAVAAVAAVPVNLGLLLRTATPAHGAALLAWIGLPALLVGVRRRSPSL